MKAVIIAGGKGERLRPLTDTIPKPMIKVSGLPILEHILRLLKKHGVTDVILALCYLPEQITNYFKDGSEMGLNISYTFEEPGKPLGTAGAILPAEKLISDTFIVTYADILRDLDIAEMIAVHCRTGSFATLNVYKHRGGNFKSALEFDEDNRLTKFEEFKKHQTMDKGFAWSNGSFYIFEPGIFKYIPKDRKSDFASDIFPTLLSAGEKVSVFPSSGRFLDIGTMENLKEAENFPLI